jgi:hypothetical protein
VNALGTISVTLPTDGTTADVADYNTPITTIVNEINGNIDNANIKSGAAISGSKLADSSIDLGTKTSTWDGWIVVTDSWTYASSTTVTVPSDATAKYSIGDRVKFTQTTIKYFQVTAVSSTTLTLFGLSGDTVANAAIGSIYYSKSLTPTGYSQSWQSWSPTWVNLSIGNGTLVFAKYLQIGKTVHFRLKFTFGGTSSISGSVTFTLPVTASSDYTTNDTINSSVQYNDSSSTRQSGEVLISTTTTAVLISNPAVYAVLSSTVPFTWATGDQILISGSYESA